MRRFEELSEYEQQVAYQVAAAHLSLDSDPSLEEIRTLAEEAYYAEPEDCVLYVEAAMAFVAHDGSPLSSEGEEVVVFGVDWDDAFAKLSREHDIEYEVTRLSARRRIEQARIAAVRQRRWRRLRRA